MATQQQYNQLVEQTQPNLEFITSIKLSELTREDDLGSQLSFKDGEAIFVKTIDLFKQLKTVNLFEVPYHLLNSFNQQITNAANLLKQIKEFNPNQANPVNVRNTLIANLENQYDTYYQHSLPLLTVGLLQGNDLSVQQSKLNQLIENFEAKNEEAEKQSEEYLKKLEETLQSAEEAAAKVGVSKHSAVFMKESVYHENQSKFWIKWTIGVLISIVVAASLLIIFFPGVNSDTNSIIQYSITKIVILSTLFYGLSICTRNYKAHRHNAIINKHRQNALTTFETFSKAAGTDNQTKAAVLMEATRTIFSNQITGYLSNDKDGESSNKIVEIFKSVAGAKE